MISLMIFNAVLFFAQVSVSHDASMMGAMTCASSACHGSPSALKGTSVSRNEFIIWLRSDRHSQAWKSLQSEDGMIIARHLGISKPEEDQKCLICHATTPISPAETFRIQDGVSCESCHGPASLWLKSHTKANTLSKDNRKLGMTALEDPILRSQTCLRCHQPDHNNKLTHQLYGAGHPRIDFELVHATSTQPAHYNIDDDYHSRKTVHSRFQFWIAGQIEQAKNTIQLLDKELNEPSKSLRLPDFQIYDCSSCHHKLEDKQFRKRTYSDLGKPPINISHLLLVAAAISIVNPKESQTAFDLINELQKSLTQENTKKIRSIIANNQEKLFQIKLSLNQSKILLQEFEKLRMRTNPSPSFELIEQIKWAEGAISTP